MAVGRSEARLTQLVGLSAAQPGIPHGSGRLRILLPAGLGTLAGFPADTEEKSPHSYLPAAPMTGQQLDIPAQAPRPQLCQHTRALCVPIMSA